MIERLTEGQMGDFAYRKGFFQKKGIEGIRDKSFKNEIVYKIIEFGAKKDSLPVKRIHFINDFEVKTAILKDGEYVYNKSEALQKDFQEYMLKVFGEEYKPLLDEYNLQKESMNKGGKE